MTDRNRCEDFAYAVMNAMTKMCYEVSDAEVARAKNQLKASLLFFQDSSHRECLLQLVGSVLSAARGSWGLWGWGTQLEHQGEGRAAEVG